MFVTLARVLAPAYASGGGRSGWLADCAPVRRRVPNVYWNPPLEVGQQGEEGE